MNTTTTETPCEGSNTTGSDVSMNRFDKDSKSADMQCGRGAESLESGCELPNDGAHQVVSPASGERSSGTFKGLVW